MHISVILPVYNEEPVIRCVLDELRHTLLSLSGMSFEILAVDDGSTDGTALALKELEGLMAELRVITLPCNMGQSAAFVAGFRKASGDLIVTMDADGQNDPADIASLVAALEDCECCCGYRANRRDPWHRRAASRLANAVRNAVLRETVRDTGCSLKAFRTPFVRHLPPWNGLHRFFPSFVAIQGGRIRQLPVNHRPRTAGTSKYTNWNRLWRGLADLHGVRWLKKRYRPLDAAIDSLPIDGIP